MHDPLTVSEAIYPSRFVQYARGHLILHLSSDKQSFRNDDACSTFIWDPVNGNHYVGSLINNEELFLNWFGNTLVSRENNLIANEELSI